MYDHIAKKLAGGGIIILDGGTGTDIQRRGVPMNTETWCAEANLSHPDIVRAVHGDYIEAGADVIIANTFATSALLFPFAFDIPRQMPGAHPCESCEAKPCLTACPVQAFDGVHYDADGCGDFLKTAPKADCMSRGCLARHACPVGQGYAYAPAQANFHMRAFLDARQKVTP